LNAKNKKQGRQSPLAWWRGVALRLAVGDVGIDIVDGNFVGRFVGPE